MKFRFEEAERAYLQAIEAKPEGFEANFAYGLFNQGLNRFGKARAAYGRCLEGAKKNGVEDALAQTLNNLGNLDSNQNRPEEARQEYQEALQIYEAAAKQNPERFSPDVARVKTLLGQLR